MAVLETAAVLDSMNERGAAETEKELKEQELDRLLEREELLVRDLERWISTYEDFGGTTEEVQKIIDDTKSAMKKRLRRLLERTSHLHMR